MSDVQKLANVLPPPTHTNTPLCSQTQGKHGMGRLAFCQSRTRSLGGRGASVQAGRVPAGLSWDSSHAGSSSLMCLSALQPTECSHGASEPHLATPAWSTSSHHCALRTHLLGSGAGNLGRGRSPAHWPGVSPVSAHARPQPREHWLLETC